jgi:hypothetical protein
LVFVRRVASVKEIKAKLEERYDDWLLATLSGHLAAHDIDELRRIVREQRERRRFT